MPDRPTPKPTPKATTADREIILAEARRALEIEIEGVQALLPRLDGGFEQAARLMLACAGKVVVTGMGKSGHIGHKLAATLASTGTPAFFLHPGEAIHGDLGMVVREDLVLAISNSGNTAEIIRLLPPLRRMGLPLIALTGDPTSELARRADVHVDVSVPREACPLGLAPTASTTAALAMGDALAVVLLKLRNFQPEDYAVFHPGGSLGKKLVTTVGDLMETGEKLPRVLETDSVEAVISELQVKRYGLTSVVDKTGRLTGVFSIGDLMRLHLSDPGLEFRAHPVSQYMTRDPRTTTPDALAARALNVMETHNIRALIVVEPDHTPVGIVGLYELLRAIDY